MDRDRASRERGVGTPSAVAGGILAGGILTVSFARKRCARGARSARKVHRAVKRTGARLLLSLVSVLVALAAAEAIFRARLATDDAPDGGDDDWRARYRRMNETIYRRSDDPILIYEPVPSSSVPMEYGLAGFDAQSMRDDHEHSETPAGPRLALIGDSLVWSEFVALEDALGRRTEEALGPRWEVLNFGVTGYDTTQEARWYEHAARPFSPSAVAVVWCMNDMMIMSGPFERYANEEERARKDAQEALLERVAPVRRETLDGVLAQREREASFEVLARALSLFARRRFDADYVDEYLVMFRQQERRERTRAALTRLAHDIRADGARPILIISPVLEDWDDYHWSAIHDFVRRASEQAGFTVVESPRHLARDTLSRGAAHRRRQPALLARRAARARRHHRRGGEGRTMSRSGAVATGAVSNAARRGRRARDRELEAGLRVRRAETGR